MAAEQPTSDDELERARASALRHYQMYEERIARQKERIATGDHPVDEATTRRWLAFDEQNLAHWKIRAGVRD